MTSPRSLNSESRPRLPNRSTQSSIVRKPHPMSAMSLCTRSPSSTLCHRIKVPVSCSQWPSVAMMAHMLSMDIFAAVFVYSWLNATSLRSVSGIYVNPSTQCEMNLPSPRPIQSFHNLHSEGYEGQYMSETCATLIPISIRTVVIVKGFQSLAGKAANNPL